MAILSQGITVKFGLSSVLATRVSVNDGNAKEGAPRVTVSHLGDNPEEEEPYELTWAAPSDNAGPKNVQVDYMGAPLSPGGTTTISITGPIAYSSTATVISSSVTAQVGDVIRSSATLRLPIPAE